MLIAVAVAIGVAAPAAQAAQHWSIGPSTPVRCDGNRACVERIAKADCLRAPHDSWHCAIYHRDHRARAPTPAATVTTSSTSWAWTYTAFDQCVVSHESGGQWNATNGTDESFYQWLPATWDQAQADVGVSFSASPFDASLAQQTYVFNLWEPHHSGAWPNTVPACGG